MPGQPADTAIPESGIAGIRIASLGSRALASIVDAFFLATMCGVAAMAAAARGFAVAAAITPAAVLTGALAILGALVYFCLCEGLFGATLGKAAAGIQVRTAAGGPCGVKASLVRNLLRAVDALGCYLFGFIVASFSGLRQRLGDRVAGTVVVERKLSRAARVALVLAWFEVLGSGLAGALWLRRMAVKQTQPATPQRMILSTPPHALVALDVQFIENDGLTLRGANYRPGDTVNLRYDISGYSTGADGRPSLEIHGMALDPSGLPLQHEWTTFFHERPGTDAALRGTFTVTLAAFVPAGTYRLALRVRDQLKNSEIAVTPTFQVDARAVHPAQGLELRDLELSAGRSDRIPPVLAGPGTIYMRGKLFGMEFEGDRVNGRIALQVTAPDGRVVFDRPEFIGVDLTSIYHPQTLWLPIEGTLDVPAGLPAGTYTERYTVTDSISRRRIAREIRFQIR